ncbi:MAG: hypothetical protein WC700_02115 [Gemmatimonadaceae bacterium]|jgi:hypothetical protein
MAQASLANRVYETSTTAGAGALTLVGAATPRHRTFLGSLGAAATTFYLISHRTLGEWEAGVGLVNGDGTLTRVTVLNNHLGTTATVTFSAGTKDVFQDVPASKMLALDTDSTTLTLPGALRLNSIAYTFPATQAANRFLKTDGAGNLSWALPTELLALTDLSDVLITTPVAGDVLRYSGAAWVNEAPTSANTVSRIVLRDAGGNFAAGTVTAALNGNASTATVLQTARNINGVSFNGSANITVTADAGTLTGATLAANVLASSLTSVGTLASLAVTGTSTLTGNVGIGGASATSVGVRILSAALATTTQSGLTANPVFTLAATSAGYGIAAAVATAAAAYTMTAGYTFAAATPTLGAGSAITTVYGFYAFNQGGAGITNAYGVYIAAQSGAATTNIGLYNAGTTTLAGAVTLSSTLAVTGTSALTGTVGVGGAAQTYSALYSASTTLIGTTQYGVWSASTFSSAATSAGYEFFGRTYTAAAAFTMTTGAVFFAETPSIGAGSTITSQYGVFVKNQGIAGVTNAYGVYISAQSGAATLNIGLYNAGTTTLVGAVTANARVTADNVALVGGILYFDNAGGSHFAQYSAGTLGIYISGALGFSQTASGSITHAGVTTLTGNVGVGGASDAGIGLWVRSTALTGTAQVGITSAATFSSASVNAGTNFLGQFTTAAAAFTVIAGYVFRATAPSLGAASAVTALYGFHAANMGAAGVANAYGVYIAAQSGAATTNIGLYNAGTTTLVGAVTANTVVSITTTATTQLISYNTAGTGCDIRFDNSGGTGSTQPRFGASSTSAYIKTNGTDALTINAAQAATFAAALTVVGSFGCNTKAAQTAYASGGALAAYGAGANGFDSGANAAALHAMVVSIRAALVANGIMS